MTPNVHGSASFGMKQMISYAVNREDVLLARAFAGQTKGFYIDVGAFHPIIHSLTRHFYQLGWRGINIEPGESFHQFSEDRPEDINLQVALSDRCGTRTLFAFPSDSEPELSTLAEDHLEHLASLGLKPIQRTIRVETLAAVCERYAPPTIDLLSIDVEGHEKQVIDGADFERFRPRVIVVEATRPLTPIPSHHEWEPLLLRAGYRLALFDGLNRYYTPPEESILAERLSVPVNVFDQYTVWDGKDSAAEMPPAMDPNVLAWAKRMARLQNRFPRLARLAKTFLIATGLV